MNGLLTEGTERRTSRQIAEAIDSVGGVVDNDVDWDSSYLSLSVLTDRADLAFDLVSDMIAHPAFQPAEIERQRKQTLSGLQVAQDDPAYVADMAIQKLIFAGTAYGHPEDGTLDSAAAHYRPGIARLPPALLPARQLHPGRRGRHHRGRCHGAGGQVFFRLEEWQ